MSDGDLYFIEDTTGGRLGRNIVNHDPRNRDFPVRGTLFEDHAPLRNKIWKRDTPPFDQLTTSSCTSQNAVGCIYTGPFRRTIIETPTWQLFDTHDERMQLYRDAQKVDPWPGEDYEGSSTDAPFKVLRDRGIIREYRWCFGLQDVLRTLANHGPVGIGINWYEGFDRPDRNGYIYPTGRVRGGHALEVIGLYLPFQHVELVNSWGPRYGVNGRCLMKWNVLERVLKENGEAVTLVT